MTSERRRAGFGVIEFEAVSKAFRRGDSALAELTVSIPDQLITALVGEAGSGKSTVLHLINRSIEPSSGRIVWDGNPVTGIRRKALRRQMGYLGRDDGLFPHRTVAENVSTVPRLLGWSTSKTNTRVRELLTDLGLGGKLSSRYPDQLSGKERCRVGLARALAGDPSVVLLDDPFASLDDDDRRELQGVLLRLQRDKARTVILTTDSIDEALTVAGHVVVLRPNGRLAQAADPQTLLDVPADDFVAGFVGVDRGYRSLSFLRADALELGTVKVVRDIGAASGEGPTLVVDGNARPVGWADPEQPGDIVPLGSTFEPRLDTLKVALDSALTSRFGLAVAIEAGTGRYSGVASASAIMQAAAAARTAVEVPTEASLSDESAPAEGLAEDGVSEDSASEDAGFAQSGPDEGRPEEPGGDEALAAEVESDALVGDQPHSDELLEDQPVSEDLVEDEPFVDELIEDQPVSDESIIDGAIAPADVSDEPDPEASPSEHAAVSTPETSPNEDSAVGPTNEDSAVGPTNEDTVNAPPLDEAAAIAPLSEDTQATESEEADQSTNVKR